MSGTPLAELQRFIADAVRGDLPVASSAGLAAQASRLLAPGKGQLDAAGRIEVYREQFWTRHLSNLEDDFPTLAWVVGPSAFREIAVAYLKHHPPRTWNLQRLGADLPAYVSTLEPWNGDPLALDACRLDWAFMVAFDAPDAGPLDLQVLASAPEDAWPNAQLELHPSLQRLSLSHAAHELRDAIKRGDAGARPEPEKNVQVVVWRDAQCFLRAAPVEPMAFELLSQLAGGTPLGLACEAVASAHASSGGAELGERVGAWFQQWTAAGWVAAVRI